METLFWLISVLVYCVLGMLAIWGTFCVIFAWRRVAQARFRTEQQQREFLGAVETHVRAQTLDQVEHLCEHDRRALPQLVLFALANRNLDYPTMQRRLVERFQRDVLADLEYRISWVGTVVRSAPMVGLLGTVIGMMGAFANLSSGEHVDSMRLAEDIQFALITTACGLAIAIPLVMCTASINVRMRKMQDLVDTGLDQLFEILKKVWLPAAGGGAARRATPGTVGKR